MDGNISQLVIYYRLLIITFFAVLFSVLVINSGDFYNKIFKPDTDSADFTSPDVPFKDRFGPITRYVGFFILFVVVFFIALMLVIYLVCVALTDADIKDRFKVAFEQKFKSFTWGKNGSAQFYIWFIIAFIMTLLFYLFYSLMNKSFLQEMRFPAAFGKAGEDSDPTADDPNRPQPKLFLMYYATFCLMVLCFGIILTSVTNNTDYIHLLVNLFAIIIFVVLIVTAFEFMLKRKPVFVVPIVLFVVFIIGSIWIVK